MRFGVCALVQGHGAKSVQEFFLVVLPPSRSALFWAWTLAAERPGLKAPSKDLERKKRPRRDFPGPRGSTFDAAQKCDMLASGAARGRRLQSSIRAGSGASMS